MITITKEFKCTSPYDLSRFGEPEKLLFFDIETTGLFARQDMVYLIGCVYLRGGCWQMKQWFADSVHAEQEILIHFFLFASRFSTLIHFNGDTFDLPFLQERTARYQIPVPGKKPVSFDIYRKVRFLKKLLNLPDCRQKTLESFLGIDRKDLYDGGQLIRFYWQYLRTGEASLYKALLLHNEEDIEGLPSLLALLSYHDFFQGPFRTESEQIKAGQTNGEAAGRELMITCINDSCSLPVPCSFSAENCQFSCHGNTLTLCLPLLEGSLIKKFIFISRIKTGPYIKALPPLWIKHTGKKRRLKLAIKTIPASFFLCQKVFAKSILFSILNTKKIHLIWNIRKGYGQIPLSCRTFFLQLFLNNVILFLFGVGFCRFT